jgi:hypothetical protein
VTIWDGGWPDQSEPEREQSWSESDGDLPFLPDPLDANEWIEPAEGEDPLYDLLKRDAEDDPEG